MWRHYRGASSVSAILRRREHGSLAYTNRFLLMTFLITESLLSRRMARSVSTLGPSSALSERPKPLDDREIFELEALRELKQRQVALLQIADGAYPNEILPARSAAI